MAKGDKRKRYLGVDVGGTKILAGVAGADGEILARKRNPTPQNGKPDETLDAIVETMSQALAKGRLKAGDLSGIGVGVPGVVAPDEGRVVCTPNMNLWDFEMAAPMEREFGVEVALGNDVNLGTLGEKWLGAAREATSAVSMFVGTGIGGALIIDGKLVRGSREVAGEIGHMIMQPGGPKCGCGMRGCFEALAGRGAIEREIRAGMAAGRETIVTKLLKKPDDLIRGKILKTALREKDALVTEVMRRASEIMGYGCLNVRHLVDPDIIVMGGGVIEACGDFVMPIIQEIVEGDPLVGAHGESRVVLSELGDDAVLLGAVALAQGYGDKKPVVAAEEPVPAYPKIEYVGFGEVAVGGKVYTADICVRGDGKVRKRKKDLAKRTSGDSHKIGPEELEGLCKGRPRLIVIGSGASGVAGLTEEGEEFLRERGIKFEVLASPEAAKAFNKAEGRRALLMHVTC